jgi:hypothetical protein
MSTIEKYLVAEKDVKLGRIPKHDDEGTYQWTPGQGKILNIPKFKDLRSFSSKISKIQDQINETYSKVISYQPIAKKYYENSGNEKKKLQDEIEKEELQCEGLKEEKVSLEEEFVLRGFVVEVDKKRDIVVPKIKPEVKKNRINWKSIFSFILIWFIGEIFMTWVMWESLRYENAIGDLLVRSISFGVILFLIHYVAHLNKKYRMRIYVIYLAFSFLMIGSMLFTPLILNQVFPLSIEDSNTSAWTISDDSFINGDIEDTYPFFVNFYRKYEVLPAILCFLFFIAIHSFVKPKKLKDMEDYKTEVPVIESKEDEHIEKAKSRLDMLEKRIVEKETRIRELKERMNSIIIPNTNGLKTIEKEINIYQEKIEAFENELNSIRASKEDLLKSLVLELNEYQADYMDILKKDEIKFHVVKPEWPTENDIKSFYNL